MAQPEDLYPYPNSPLSVDHFFESPQLEDIFNLFLESNSNPQPPLLLQSPAPKKRAKCKLQKTGRIRTNRNSQKIYHNILKHWLIDNQLGLLANKYNKYFHQRIYFILLLHEIVKRIDGETFLAAYQHLAAEVKKKKEREIHASQEEVEGCEYINHLARIIEEIDFSITACHQFMQGNVLNAITVVFKRSQKRITKVKEFKEAINIYIRETGCEVWE